MKKIKNVLFALLIILLGCQCRDAGGQPATQAAPAPPQPQAATPQPPPQPTYNVVKMADGHEMVKVPAGEFKRGNDTGEPDEKPVKTITLSEFLIDRYEVSNANYELCVAAKKCKRITPKDGFDAPDQPAYGLSWDMARAYCAWAGERLPTEAEWEKAARGTDGRRYPWGNDPPTPDYATFGITTTTPVTSNPKGVSPYGAFNMAGNISEWVQDWYQKDYFASSPQTNPRGPKSGEYRVIRGGNYMNSLDHVRADYRVWERPDYAMPGYGVRCAK